jgi:ribonuclease HII
VKPSPTHQHVDDLRRRGYPVVAGVDEVGRGALAGPVVAAAVILPAGVDLDGVRDSKQLSLLQRHKAADLIRRSAVAIGIGWSGHDEIDQQGLSWAVCASGQRALAGLGTDYDAVLLDGQHNYLRDYCYTETLIKADALSVSVAAASIIAKVARDNYMQLMHQLYPQYGFDNNVGYGTMQHLEALLSTWSPIHRQSFAPLKARNYVN